MVEFGYKGAMKYSALRKDIRRAFRGETSTVPYKVGNSMENRAWFRKMASSVWIGCYLFDEEDTKKLKEWALAEAGAGR
jgi:hypothetical protein